MLNWYQVSISSELQFLLLVLPLFTLNRHQTFKATRYIPIRGQSVQSISIYKFFSRQKPSILLFMSMPELVLFSLKALSNGSCVHRAVLNNKMAPHKYMAIYRLGGHQVPLIILSIFYVSFMAIIDKYGIPFLSKNDWQSE